jgi:hypothetical protein
VPENRQSGVQKSINLAATATEGAKVLGIKVYNSQTLCEVFAAGRNLQNWHDRCCYNTDAANEAQGRNAAVNS